MHENMNSMQKKNVLHYVRVKEERKDAGGDAKMELELKHEESRVKLVKGEM